MLARTGCDGYPITSWQETCIDYNCTAGGNHSPGQSCQGDPSEQPYTVCTGAWVHDCIPTESIDAGDSGGSGGGGGSSNDDDNEEGIAIIPLSPKQVKKQCEKITNLLDDPNNSLFKQKLLDLATPANLNLNYEKSVSLYENSPNLEEHSGLSNTGSTRMNPNPPSNYIAFAHTHPNDSLGTYSIFSFKDLAAMSNSLSTGNLDSSKFVAFLSTSKGTHYALTIDDPNKFLDFFYYWNNSATPSNFSTWYNSYNRAQNLEKVFYLDPNNPLISQTDTNNGNVLVKFLSFMNQADMGVSLFETNSTFDNFTRLSKDSVGTLITENCDDY